MKYYSPAQRRIRSILRSLVILAVIFLLIYIFGFRYAPSAIFIRRTFAKTLIETEHHDSVRQIYMDIISLDPEREESYLEIAEYEEEWMDRPHIAAWEWVTMGISECGKTRELIKRATLLAYLRTDDFLNDGEYRLALTFMETAIQTGVKESDLYDHFLRAYTMEAGQLFEEKKYEELVVAFESLDKNYQEEEELRSYYLQAYPLLIRLKIQEKDPERAIELLGRLPDELKDIEEMERLRLEAVLLLAKEKIAAGEYEEALLAVLAAREIDPSNEVARILYLQLTGTEEDSLIPPVDSYTAEGTLTLHMTAGAFLLTTPLDVTAPVSLTMSGLATDTPSLTYEIDATAEILGQNESFAMSDEIIGDGDEESIAQMKNTYAILTSNAVSDGTRTEIDGIPCLVYTYKVEHGDLEPLAQAVMNVFSADGSEQDLISDALPLIEADVTRYVAVDSGDLVRIEANLDQTDFAAILTPYLGDELPEGTSLSGEQASLVLDIKDIVRADINGEE